MMTLNIINFIRTITIPPDPTGNYSLIDVSKQYNFINLFYFTNANTNFINNSNNPVNEFFGYINLYKDPTLQIPDGYGLFNIVQTPNVLNQSLNDILAFQAFQGI